MDPYGPIPKKQALLLQNLQLVRNETICIGNVKGSERELHEIILSRRQEEAETLLHVSVYDTVRNVAVGRGLLDQLLKGPCQGPVSPRTPSTPSIAAERRRAAGDRRAGQGGGGCPGGYP